MREKERESAHNGKTTEEAAYFICCLRRSVEDDFGTLPHPRRPVNHQAPFFSSAVALENDHLGSFGPVTDSLEGRGKEKKLK